jgi:L-fuculose-phosphate aldolase
MSARAQKSGRMTREEREARRAVLNGALDMSRRGLSPGRSGNVSCRWGEGMLITPSGMAYETIGIEDIVLVDGQGRPAAGQRKPSSEAAFHLAAYVARPDRHAMVHTHSMHATVLACAHQSIPAFHYMVAAAGGNDIPCVPYATFGTEALAQHVARGLKARDACLMANHGAVAVGETVASALELAFSVEVLAEQYVKLLAFTKPKILSDAEMKIVVEKFKGYGQAAQKTRNA